MKEEKIRRFLSMAVIVGGIAIVVQNETCLR